MGIWAEIKTTLNSTLGNNLKPLDEIVEEQAYENYYNSIISNPSNFAANGGDVFVVEKGIQDLKLEDFRNVSDEIKSRAKSIVFPWGLRNMGARLGENNVGLVALETIVLPSTCAYITSSAFSSLQNLKYIVWSKNVKSIQGVTFTGDKNLRALNFPEGLTTIHENGIKGCQNLSVLRLPSTLTKIWSNGIYRTAFDAPLTIYYSGTVAEWNEIDMSADSIVSFENAVSVVCSDGVVTISPTV
jgi:hypothetical protein